jgi:hypothetical protein
MIVRHNHARLSQVVQAIGGLVLPDGIVNSALSEAKAGDLPSLLALEGAGSAAVGPSILEAQPQHELQLARCASPDPGFGKVFFRGANGR